MRRSRLELLAWPAYLLGFALFAEPLSDAVLAVWPLRFGTMSWRFGSTGVLSGGLMTPILALLIVATTSAALGHRRAQRLIGLLCGAVFVVLLAMTGVFVLDSIATRSIMAEGGAVSSVQYTVTVAKAIVKLLLAAGCAGGLAWAAFRTPDAPPESTRKASSTPLVASSARLDKGNS